jgi:hypothetical protein
MKDFIFWLIVFGIVCFIVFTIFDFLGAVVRLCMALYRRNVSGPREDAEESFTALQAWQRENDFPIQRRDPTRPDDEDDGLSPLVELWRRR